jgi:hypothetical protein
MAQLASAQGPLKSLGGSDGAGQMTHFVNDDNLNLFRLREYLGLYVVANSDNI